MKVEYKSRGKPKFCELKIVVQSSERDIDSFNSLMTALSKQMVNVNLAEDTIVVEKGCSMESTGFDLDIGCPKAWLTSDTNYSFSKYLNDDHFESDFYVIIPEHTVVKPYFMIHVVEAVKKMAASMFTTKAKSKTYRCVKFFDKENFVANEKVVKCELPRIVNKNHIEHMNSSLDEGVKDGDMTVEYGTEDPVLNIYSKDKDSCMYDSHGIVYLRQRL